MSDYELSRGNFPYWTRNYWFLWWPAFIVVTELPPENFICLLQKDERSVFISRCCIYVSLKREKRFWEIIMIQCRMIIIFSDCRILKVYKETNEVTPITEEVINVS